MNAFQLQLSREVIHFAAIAILYVPAAALVYWQLMPRLSSRSRLLASIFLLLQVALILLARAHPEQTGYWSWLWNLRWEYNVPATFSSTQMMMLSGVALLTAWRLRDYRDRRRLYLLGLGLVFLFLAADEYLSFHEAIVHWELRYLLLGLAVVAATLLVARRSPPGARIWHFLLLAGLAISVAGAMIINSLPLPCGSLAFLRFEGCLELPVLEESYEMLGIWLTFVAVLGYCGERAPRLSKRAWRILVALPIIWLLSLLLYSLIPQLELRLMAKPAAVAFDTGLELRGYHIDEGADDATVRLYATARQADYPWLGFTIVYLDQASEEELSRGDIFSRGQILWYIGADVHPIFRERVELPIPPGIAENRAYWIALTHWREWAGEFDHRAVVSSDLPQLTDRHVVLGESLRRAPKAPANDAPLAIFVNGFALQSFDLPESAKAGQPLPISFTWRSDINSDDDHIQFLHLRHEDTGEYFVHDQPPLGARLPTRLWYAGLMDSETWLLPLPADLQPGKYTAFTGLYRKSDKARVPVANADGVAWTDDRLALGAIMIREAQS